MTKKYCCVCLLLILSSFFLGFNRPVIFISLVSLSLLFMLKGESKVSIRLFVLSLIVFSYQLVFYFGNSDYISNSENAINIITYSFFFFIYLFLLNNVNSEFIYKSIIPVICFGVFLRVVLTVLYSIYMGPQYGYGLVIDPIRGYETNSPGYSNILILPMCYFFHYCLNNKNFFGILSGMFFIVSIYCAVYLSGRFIFIAFCIFLFMLFFSFKTKKKLYLFLFITLFIPLVFTFLKENETFLFLIDRFTSGGSNSQRIEHLMYGVNQLIENPLGSFAVDKSSEITFWFHNLYLDAAKVLGFITFLPIFLLTIFFQLYLFNNKNYYIVSMYSFILLITMMQDVVMEENYILFFLYLFFSLSPFFTNTSDFSNDKYCNC